MSEGYFYTAKKDRIVWKKAFRYEDDVSGGHVLVRLLLPAGTRYFRSTGDQGKCRAEKLKVLRIYDDGKPAKGLDARSYWDPAFQYIPGRIVKPVGPFDRCPEACASGVHFFRTRAEAEEYDFT